MILFSKGISNMASLFPMGSLVNAAPAVTVGSIDADCYGGSDRVTPLNDFASSLDAEVVYDDDWVNRLYAISGHIGWSRCSSVLESAKHGILNLLGMSPSHKHVVIDIDKLNIPSDLLLFLFLSAGMMSALPIAAALSKEWDAIGDKGDRSIEMRFRLEHNANVVDMHDPCRFIHFDLQGKLVVAKLVTNSKRKGCTGTCPG